MKYLLMLNNSTDEYRFWDTLSAEEAGKLREQEIPKWGELFGWMGQKGIDSQGLELEVPSKARTVRVRDAQVLVTDGPFAETKELLGGYFLVDLADLDEAIELASRVPVAEKGSVEIRPLVE